VTYRSIIPTLLPVVHPEQARRLAFIDTEDYDPVARKVRQHFVDTGTSFSSGYIQRGIFALKQYYAVALLDPGNAHAISRPLDPFWHAHVLHSEEYTDFCKRVVGEYMHHRPLDHSKSEHVAAVRRLYDYTLDVLPKIFSTVDAQFWPANVADDALICYHKGNQDGIYNEIQPYRLFEPSSRGSEAGLR